MNTKIIAPASAAALIIGMLFYAIAQEWIIIVPPAFIATTHEQQTIQSQRKKVTFYYWHRNKWQQETSDLLWSSDYTVALRHLITQWLAVAHEEKMIEKLVTVQSVLISASGQDAYISFDSNPLPKQKSTFEKWMIIEGMLKTVRENYPEIQALWFLVRHQPLHDAHLDFNTAWPLVGFIQN